MSLAMMWAFVIMILVDKPFYYSIAGIAAVTFINFLEIQNEKRIRKEQE